MNNDNSTKILTTYNTNTLVKLNQETDPSKLKSLFNPSVVQSFKTQELQNNNHNINFNYNNKQAQIENSSSQLLGATSSIIKDKGSEQSHLGNKLSYFSRKTLTLNKIKTLQVLSKEESQSKEWESIYKADEGSRFGKVITIIRYADYFIISFSFLSIVFALIDNELYTNNNQALLNKYHVNEINPIDLKITDYLYIQTRKLELNENVVRSLNILSSCLLFISIIIEYCFKVELLKLENKLSKYEGLASSSLVTQMVIELVLSLIVFPPKLHNVYLIESSSSMLLSLNTLFNTLTLVKFYFVFRITNYCMKWNKKVSQTITKSHRIKRGMVFSLKCELKEKPFTTLIFSCLFFIIIAGMIIRSFEYLAVTPTQGLVGTKGINDLRDIFTTFWLIITTITAVGFGDNTPRTSMGRAFIFASSVFGLLFTCLVIVTISSYYSDLTHEEAKAFLKLKKLHHRDNKHHKASNVIRLLLFLHKLYRHQIEKKKLLYQNETFGLFALLITHIKLMKNDYKISSSYATPITDILKSAEQKVSENISIFTKSIEQLNEIETDMSSIESLHREADESLTSICAMQNEIAEWLLNKFNEMSLRKTTKKKTKKLIRNIRTVSGTIIFGNRSINKNCMATVIQPQILRRHSFKQKKSISLEKKDGGNIEEKLDISVDQRVTENDIKPVYKEKEFENVIDITQSE